MKKILSLMTAALLALSLASGVSAAAPAKKSAKKAPAKKTVQKADKEFAEGNNILGRTGLLWSETAQAPAKGEFGGAAHLLLMMSSESETFFGTEVESSMTSIYVPVGVNFGIAKNFEVGASLDFVSTSYSSEVNGTEVGSGDASGLNDLTLGGKYVIEGKNSPVNFAVGADIALGPMSDDLGESTTDFAPKGIVTFTTKSGLVLNGSLAFVITGGYDIETPIGDIEVDPDNYVQLGAGVGIPVSPKLSVIGELGLNTYGDSGSILGAGIRTAGKMPLQALLGIGIDDFAPDFIIGGGICF